MGRSSISLQGKLLATSQSCCMQCHKVCSGDSPLVVLALLYLLTFMGLSLTPQNCSSLLLSGPSTVNCAQALLNWMTASVKLLRQRDVRGIWVSLVQVLLVALFKKQPHPWRPRAATWNTPGAFTKHCAAGKPVLHAAGRHCWWWASLCLPEVG